MTNIHNQTLQEMYEDEMLDVSELKSVYNDYVAAIEKVKKANTFIKEMGWCESGEPNEIDFFNNSESSLSQCINYLSNTIEELETCLIETKKTLDEQLQD